MKRFLSLLAAAIAVVALAAISPARAQITGTYTCPVSITFSSGSATAATASTCTVFETYAYAATPATAPYPSSLLIPAVPNGSASSLQSIAANLLADLSSAQTFTGAKKFTNSDLLLLGSSTGATTFASANASATNYTVTFPAATDTVDLISAAQNLTNKTLVSPTLSGTVAGAGTIPNSVLVNASTTVNGTTCTLGSTCSPTAVASSLAVGTTTITSGTNGNIEYNNGGILGEKGVTGSGNVVLTSAPTISSPTITGALTAVGLVNNADLVAGSFPAITGVGTLTSLTVSGQTVGNLSGSTAPALVVNGFQAVGAAGTAAGVQANAFANMGDFAGMRANGTPASPTAVTTGDNIAAFYGNAYNGSAYTTGNLAGVFLKATQPFTPSANGTRIDFTTTANGATVSADNMVLDQNGAVLLPASASNPGTNGLAVTGPATFASSLSFTGLGTGTIANSICQTSSGAIVIASAANCFTAGSGVGSVTGTAGQVTASPTTGNVVVSLPATLTPNETISGQWNYTGGAVVPPVTSPCGATITPTVATQNIECTISANTTINVPSPFVAGESYYLDLTQGTTPHPVSVAANIYVPGGGIAQLQQPVANDEDLLACKTKVIGGTNSFVCGQLLQLRQPPSYHVGCVNTTTSSVSSISCSFTGGYNPPVGSTMMVGVYTNSGSTSSIITSYTFTGGSGSSCTTPANGFVQSNYPETLDTASCSVGGTGMTAVQANFSSSVTNAGILVDVFTNVYGIDNSAINATMTATTTPTSGQAVTNKDDIIWGVLGDGGAGTTTAGPGFTLGQNNANTWVSEYGIFSPGLRAANFNTTSSAGYLSGAIMGLP